MRKIHNTSKWKSELNIAVLKHNIAGQNGYIWQLCILQELLSKPKYTVACTENTFSGNGNGIIESDLFLFHCNVNIFSNVN